MSILDLLSTLDELNISVYIEENRLEIEAPDGIMTQQLICELKENKEELIKFFSDGKKTNVYSGLKPVSKKEYYTLSSPQKRMYLLQQLDLETTAYNIPTIINIDIAPDKDMLQDIFMKLIKRHESLRSSFKIVDDEPVQIIHADVDFKIESIDAAGLEQGTGAANEPEKIIKCFTRFFDLEKAPLLRIALIRVEGDVLLLIDIHHIISDGISFRVLEEEIKALTNRQALPALEFQYKDYVEWQRGPGYRRLVKSREEYWLHRFFDSLPVLDLPTDYPRPTVRSFVGNKVRFRLSEEETGIIKNITKKTNTTLYMVILSLYNIMLSKLSGDEDIIIAAPIAGRRHPYCERIIGMFVNTLAVRSFPAGRKSYKEFLSEIKESTLEAFENQEYQFEELVDKLNVSRNTGRNPISDVLFNHLNQAEHSKDSIKLFEEEEYIHKEGIAKFDLTLTTFEHEDRLCCSFEYYMELFKIVTVTRFISYFRKIISEISCDFEKKISDIEIISEVERNQLLFEFNDTRADYPANKLVHMFFEEQVKRTPDNIALFYEDISLSYECLDKRIEEIAGALSREGISQGSVVGIMVERSPEMLLGIMGILRASGTYLPIDPGFPGDRKCYILKDSRAKILLTTHKLYNDVMKFRDLEVRKVFFEAIEKSKNKKSSMASFPLSSSGNPAYVIYTSGSTGFPKGVMIEHKSVVNLLVDLQKRYPFMDTDTYLLKTAYIFDVSITELFGWFMGGGVLAILPVGGDNDPYLILDEIERGNVTHINFVPSMFNAFVEALTTENISELVNLRYIFLAGEALSPGLVKKFNRFSTDILLENIYGPTEAAVYACGYSLSLWDGKSDIPIGKPIRNLSLYILDKYDKLQGVGIVGELSIGGVSAARGYLNNPGLTAEKFVENPYLSHTTHLYKTGDLARWLPNGTIEFLGRQDQQVKIRGYRVEPGEIEGHLLGIEGIKEAVVIDREEEQGYKHLCAYIVPDEVQRKRVSKAQVKGEFAIDIAAVKNELLKELPDYMIPSYFVEIDAVPLTPGGKVDRKVLPAPAMEAGTDYRAPGNELEKRLVEIWSEILSIDKNVIGIDDNFFEIGGHSLRATILASRLHKEFNVNIRLIELFSIPTVIGIANLISISKSRRERIIAASEEREKVLL